MDKNFFGDENEQDEDVGEAKVDPNCDYSPSEVESEEMSNSDSASEDEDDFEVQLTTQRQILYGKDKHKWSLIAPNAYNRRSKLSLHIAAAKESALHAKEPLDFWSLLLSDELLSQVLKWTNKEIQKYKNSCVTHPTSSSTVEDLTMNELKAFIGLMYFCGLKRSNDISTEEMWSAQFGCTLLRATMSCRRFEFIAANLCFDDSDTLEERNNDDMLAPIRKIWDYFIKNCIDNYTPSEYCTVGTQLLNFRGQFPAKVFINKSNRYGIKLFSLHDSETYYMYNALVYTGVTYNEPGESNTSYYVRTLCEPIAGTRRNVTCDSYFTSLDLFNSITRNHNLTMVGAMHKTERQIPASFKKCLTPDTVRYAYDSNNILVSYTPKKKKPILLLSSLHKSGDADEISGKPEIWEFYNRTVVAGEYFEQLCYSFSCARKTNKWPTRFFMGMLDQASVNSCILYNFLLSNKLMSRRQFLKSLCMALVTPFLKDRLKKHGMSKRISMSICDILGIKELTFDTIERTDKMPKRKRCFFCKNKEDRKTKLCCARCQRPVCGFHKLTYCHHCVE